MAQPSPAVIRLDQPGHAATETELLRFPAPLLDADVAKRCGCDASGLNAAIIVLRHVYWLLQRELTEASQALQQEPEEWSEGGSGIRRALIQKAADRRRRALNALHESEARFSLLAAAWLNTPLHAQASMQETIRGCHGEILDAFFRTRKGPDNDLSFAQILDREQARTEVWSDPCFSLVHGRALVYRPDGVWAPTGERGAQDSSVTWKPDAQGSLAALLGSFFRTKVEGGPPSCAVPGYPSVLRIRYVPGERAGSGVNELRNTEIPEMTIQGQLRKGELLIHSFGFGPHPSIYRLFAAVRLRGSPTERDLIRVFDPHTPLADDVGTPLALVNWQLGAAGHEYDLFYAPPPLEEGARRSEEPMAKGFSATAGSARGTEVTGGSSRFALVFRAHLAAMIPTRQRTSAVNTTTSAAPSHVRITRVAPHHVAAGLPAKQKTGTVNTAIAASFPAKEKTSTVQNAVPTATPHERMTCVIRLHIAATLLGARRTS